MTQTAEQSAVPLTNPVPGAWIQPADSALAPVYVPYEAQYRKNEQTNRDELTGHAPGAHIKRLLSEGAMYAQIPTGVAPALPAEASATEAALRAELEQMRQSQEGLMEELKALREKMASDGQVPNAPKRTR